MSHIKISVIITIYNAEKDMHIMLDSLKSQKFQGLEYILIDNGSTDGTHAICERYAHEDSRFKIQTIEKNIGYIQARNYGLSVCGGEYVTFADADDYVADDAYSLMYKTAKENDADWIIAPYYMNFPDGKERFISLSIPGGIYKGKDIFDNIVPIAFGYNKAGIILDGFMWRMMFRTELVESIDNMFYEEAKPKEDQLFNQRISCFAKTVAVIDLPVYHYRCNPDSVTAKLSKNFDLKSECQRTKFHFEQSLKNMTEGNVEQYALYSIYSNLFQSIYVLCLNVAKTYAFSKLKVGADILTKYFPLELLKKMCAIRKDSAMSRLEKTVCFFLNKGNFCMLMWLIKISLKIKGKG